MSSKIQSLKQDIETIDELHEYLRIAMEVELSTIPAYLSAIYSLKPGTNQAAREVMYSVVIEEMLHLTLAGNVLRATNGYAAVNHKEYVPRYPTPLPDGDIHQEGKVFEVPLQKFSPAALETFLRIERPQGANTVPKARGWHTIGQFYAGLQRGIDILCDKHGTAEVFKGKVADQIRPEDYYGGAGEVIVVAHEDPDVAYRNAKAAFEEIVDQGEGMDRGVMDGDEIPAKRGTAKLVPAHYFRFDEIKQGRRYRAGDRPGHPTGPKLEVDYEAVYNVRQNPCMAQYEAGGEIYDELADFNRAYMNLLTVINDAFNKDRTLLMKAVGTMYDLKYKAVALVKTPSGDGETTVGPSFEYWPPDE